MLNTKNCFVFLMSCSLSLSFTLLVSFCLLLPLPMTGLQLLWLTVVILPILALSLIGTPADAGLMSQMTGKRISNIYVSQYLIGTELRDVLINRKHLSQSVIGTEFRDVVVNRKHYETL